MTSIENEMSEILFKEPYEYCVMGIHKYNDKIYTIFVNNDIITKNGYIKSESEYEGCRISLLYPEYIEINEDCYKLNQSQLRQFNINMHKYWDYIKSISDYNLGECPDYNKLIL